MMSGIPLPTQPSLQPGGLQGVYNELLKSSAEAKYAPYQQYANALLTNQQAQWLPYQYRMQALSNPMIWMAAQNNPALQQQLSKLMSDPTQGIGGGMPNIPSPGGSSGGLFGKVGDLGNALLSKLGIGTSDSGKLSTNGALNPMGSPPSEFGAVNQASAADIAAPSANYSAGQQNNSGSGNAFLPATGGPISAVAGHTTAPYNTQAVDPGKTIYDPNTGKSISAPSGRFTTALQTSVNAAQRVEPQLERIATEASPFMSLQGEANTQYQRLKNYALGGQSDLPTKYAKFKSDLKAAPEALVKSYGLTPTNETIQRMSDVIEPYRGETGDQYKQRILNTLGQLKQEQINLAQSQLAGGMTVNTTGSNNKNNTESSSDTSSSNTGNGGAFDVNKFLSYNFSGPEEFKKSVDSLNNANKQKVLSEMKRRGWH